MTLPPSGMIVHKPKQASLQDEMSAWYLTAERGLRNGWLAVPICENA